MKTYQPILSILFVLFIASCAPQKEKTIFTSDGVWMQLGYGKIFEIKADSVRIYDICKSGCNLSEHELLSSNGLIESFSKDSLMLKKNIKTYKFVRLEKLPTSCNESQIDSDDPIYNFEVLWNTFNEQYAFFEKRNADWDATYETYKRKISSNTTELELFLILEEMLDSLNDGHVVLEAPESIQDTLQSLKEEKANSTTIKPKIGRFGLGDKIADQYCPDHKSHNAGIVKWGFMKDNIAYVQINAMVFLAYYDLPTNLALGDFVPLYGAEMDKRTFQRQDEIDGARLVMDTIINDVKTADAMIIDLRFNTGGKDEAGLEFLGHLIEKDMKIGSKKAVKQPGFTNHQDIYMESRLPNFKKDIYVLTSHITASAAELAVMATLSEPRFTRIGSNTEGIFSDMLDRQLPIGWNYALSNEIYEDLDGNNYEGVGISPDINLGYSKDKGTMLNLMLEQLDSKGDTAIEEVYKLERAKK